jgi:hemerythrin-like domain-containing protein
MAPIPRITGPLKTWYDLHEAIAHEIRALATWADSLDATTLVLFAERFSWFAGELRTHSEVEDGILFSAIQAAGGQVASAFNDDHHDEQTLVYDTGCAILDARVQPTSNKFARVADLLARLRDGLLPHLEREEQVVLPQVPAYFDDDAQAALLSAIIHDIPADPRLQPWIAAALTPEHREARLRNMAVSLPREALVKVLRQIRDGVNKNVWADVSARTPDLAALVDNQS